jgi:hypothetical protein
VSEYQPARLVHAHRDKAQPGYVYNFPTDTVVMVAEAALWTVPIESFRKSGCDAKRFFYLSREDQAKITGDEDGFTCFCEHEILTD